MTHTLNEYTQDVSKFLFKWSRKRGWRIREYNDLLADLIYIAAKSDESWNEVKAGGSTKYAYRKLNMLRYLTKYVKRKQNDRLVSYDVDPTDDHTLKSRKQYYLDCIASTNNNEDYNLIKIDKQTLMNYLKNNSNLTFLQKEHVDCFLKGLSYKQIAENYGTSTENVSQILKESIKKMKVLTGAKP